MKIRIFAVAIAALGALGGCATYDYASGSAPGGYYSAPAQVEYYGSYNYGYGYPYGSGFGFYGYPYGGYGYPYGYYRPPYYGHGGSRPQHPRPDGHDGHGPRPPSGQHRSDRDGAPWRNLDRLTDERGQRNERQRPAPRNFQTPQGGSPRSAPAPRQRSAPPARSQGGGGMTRAIERARQSRSP